MTIGSKATVFLHRSPPSYAALISLLLVLSGGLISDTDAHVGRRLAIEVVNGRLQAQGMNTGDADGLPIVRPYLNTIHDHWRNVPELGTAVSTLPDFDVTRSAATPLQNYRLDLELRGVTRWVDPPLMPPIGTKPQLVPLEAGQVVTLLGSDREINSQERGTLQLLQSVPFGGLDDLNLVYQVNAMPINEIHVLEVILSAVPNDHSSSSIAPSKPIRILLSPDGPTPMVRLHHASLFLENYLATIPEPSSIMSLFVAMLTIMARYGRRRRALATF